MFFEKYTFSLNLAGLGQVALLKCLETLPQKQKLRNPSWKLSLFMAVCLDCDPHHHTLISTLCLLMALNKFQVLDLKKEKKYV